MSTEITLIKTSTGFEFASELDREVASCYKIGSQVKVSAVKQSSRSLQHHKLFFGGLLELMYHYWEPDEVFNTEVERKIISQFCKLLDENGGGGEVAVWGDMFLSKISQSRASQFTSPGKTRLGLLNWIKDKAGHVDVVSTPSGIKKIPKSINFNSMSQEEFSVFYKKCFSACWQYILSQKFDNPGDCQNAINQLSSMG